MEWFRAPLTIVLTTVGSTGDVVPHRVLANALLAAGHRVRVVSHAFHRPFFEAAGLEFVSVGGPDSKMDFNRAVDEAARQNAPLRQFEVLMRRCFFTDARRRFEVLKSAVSDASCVVSQAFDYLGQEAAIARDLPWASVTLTPQLIRTGEAPVYPAPSLGPRIDAFTWRTLEQMTERLNRYVGDVLSSLGRPPRDLGIAGARSPHLDLVPASPHLSLRRSDWPPHTVMTGAWFDAASDYEAPDELQVFLRRHEPPVVVTFGSMGGADARATSRLLIEALQRAGRPAIVQAGYADLLRGATVSPRILAVGHVPHAYLFAKAAVVVHHAGAGTAAAVARAGVPSVPVPHLFDQYYWAGRLHDVGAATKPVFRHQLSAKRLARRLGQSAAAVVRIGSTALAHKMRTDRGVEAAVEAIESHLLSG